MISTSVKQVFRSLSNKHGAVLYRQHLLTQKVVTLPSRSIHLVKRNATRSCSCADTLKISQLTARHIHLPHFPKHIADKYELLLQARGFFQRLKIRIKYPLMRQMRPFTLNDVTALFALFFLGNVSWLVFRTTSFISTGLWITSSLQLEDRVAKKMGQLLTLASDSVVTFDSVTPNWKDGKIRLNNVRVYCMPRSELKKFRNGIQEKEPEIIQGNILENIELDIDEKSARNMKKLKRQPWYDLTIDSIEIELSLIRLMEGKGLIKNADIKGARGIVDNRRSGWNKSASWSAEEVRKSHIPGDFEIEGLKIKDLSVVVYMTHGFRPFSVSVLQARFPRWRKQWLLYDSLCTESMIGSLDGSLFSIHTPQLEKSVLEHSDLDDKGSQPDLSAYYPYRKLDPQGVLVGGENKLFGIMTDDDMKKKGYKRQSRIRIEGVSLDHVRRFGKGPPQWIKSGTLDFSADIYIPVETQKESTSVPKAILELIRQSLPHSITLGTGTGKHIVLGKSDIDLDTNREKEEPKKLVIDIDVRYKNVKAIVPLHIPELGYLNSAMVRPLVAYLNNNRTLLPIKGRIIMDLSLFNGAWTIHDSTLANQLNKCITKGLVDLVTDHQERNRRLKQIGFWSFREMIRNIVVLHDTLNGSARGFWSYLGE